MKKSVKPNFRYEKEFSKGDDFFIAGIDEVGRGALAGPIVAAAVVFQNYDKVIRSLREVNDSKILTAEKRKELSEVIMKKSYSFGIGMISNKQIDKVGIGAANILAFKQAIENLNVKCDFALIDGRRFRGFEYRYMCLEKGESKSLSIAAASIIAKVYRDELMEKLIEDDIYGFGGNKGYGSKIHYQALEEYGPSVHHRRTFLKKFQEKKDRQTLF